MFSNQQDLVHNVAALPRDIIDIEVFEQLLEMDEDDYEFSQSLVYNYFEQAESTFGQMQSALFVSMTHTSSSRALEEVSTLAHFLKGSSAAVGVIRVRDSCEIMQHYGTCFDADGTTELAEDDAIAKLIDTMAQVQAQYREAEATLRGFFGA